jgi:hypothetical protein
MLFAVLACERLEDANSPAKLQWLGAGSSFGHAEAIDRRSRQRNCLGANRPLNHAIAFRNVSFSCGDTSSETFF